MCGLCVMQCEWLMQLQLCHIRVYISSSAHTDYPVILPDKVK